MQKSSAPLQFVLPFAANADTGYRHTIPVPSQTGTDPALASYNDGFPPATMEQSGAGGLPPYGQDMNGVLYAATLALQWQQAGFMYPYSSAFATASTVSGYPAGALLLGSGGYNLWLSLGDNNQTNPDSSAGSGWMPVFANAGATTVNTTGGSVTLTQNQLTSELINITGALTSNLTLVLPLTNGARYLVKNSTTGAFTVTIQGATGSGVTISSSLPQHVFTDGTNWYGVGLTGGPYLPLSGTAAAATKLATGRTIAMTGDIAWTSGAFDGTSNVTGLGTIQPGAVTLAKMAVFQANSLMGNPTGSSVTPVAITIASPLQFSSGVLGLSYTPVNKAGDTMTGPLVFQDSAGYGVQFIRGAGIGAEIWKDTNATDLWYFDQKNNTDIIFRTGSTTEQFRVMNTGGVRATSYNTVSDETVKAGIQRDVEPRDLSAAVYATWTHLCGRPVQGRGTLAQSMLKVAPEYVLKGSDEKLSVDYSLAAYEQAMFNAGRIKSIEACLARIAS